MVALTIKDNETVFIAYNENNQNEGVGLIHEVPENHEILGTRLNFFINIEVPDGENKLEIRDALFEKLMERVHEMRQKNKEMDAKVFHSCPVDKYEEIQYYLSKEGFRRDEGMYAFGNKLKYDQYNWTKIEGVHFTAMDFDNEEDLLMLEKVDPDIFFNNFSRKNIEELKLKDDWKLIAAIHEGEIIGNINIFFGNSNSKDAWIDDVFVREEWRDKGIGKNLVIKALEYSKARNEKSLKAEVWSTNPRFIHVLRNVGFDLEGEIEVVVGKYI